MLATIPAWRDVFRLRAIWLISAFLLWMAISTLWSQDWSLRDAFSVWVRCLLVFMFVVAVADCQLRGQLQRWMTQALTAVGVVVVVAAIAVYFWTNPPDGRLNGLGQLDTHVIAALVYGVVLLFVLRFIAIPQPTWRRWLGVVIALLVISAVLLSDSRNVWISVLVGGLVFLLAHRVQSATRFVAALGVTAVVLTLGVGIAITSDTLSPLMLPRGDSFRVQIWSEVVTRLQGNWVFGLGILTTDDLEFAGILFHHPHSMYLSLIHQAGVVALLMYLAVIAWTLATLVRNYQHADAKLAISILALALTAHLLDGHELVDKVGSSWFLIWLPVAMAVGLRWAEPDFVGAEDLDS